VSVAGFLLAHAHSPEECRPAFASWRGFDSPLRRRPAICSCRTGGHELWWLTEAESEDAALAMLPRYVRERCRAVRVSSIDLP
jgi:hypothetical protein